MENFVLTGANAKKFGRFWTFISAWWSNRSSRLWRRKSVSNR